MGGRVRVWGLGVLGAAAGDGGTGGGGGGAAGLEIGGGGGGGGGQFFFLAGIFGEVGDGLVPALKAEVGLDFLLVAAAADEGLGVGVVPAGEAELGGGVTMAE